MTATTDEALALSAIQVQVHPLVLLSVTDHASRSATGARKRVLGVLLGQDNGASINVANSFAVPFEEDEGGADGAKSTWFLDHDYIESMMEMSKKVTAREKMVGWYHTGPRLRASDLEINDLMKRFIPRPVMVIVDPRSRDTGIPTDAYFAVEEIKEDGTATQKTFTHVPSSIVAEESEEIGVEHLLRDIRDTTTVGTLSTRVSAQLSSLRGLQSRLVEIREYLELVVAGKLVVNHQIIYNLQDIFNLLPDIDNANSDAAIKQSFSVANNDQMLVVYLSSLIRAVIALHALVDNRAENARGEEEGEGAGGDKEKEEKEKDKGEAAAGKEKKEEKKEKK
ncbi:Mov34-domain-containing protein [Tilletiopsis washingtonensis]|uniref:Mov34-domain-containing protein n=1 Tax=Tilletiopsis washingtonensis TaxID=58919 RepID=A0A316Z5W5_9BASI|nr:Mov34-domain-containing protein [Tilletiopsis washingtonensis]PWN96358.1 Mov34-domain-containing protein [Tilletiopsis washingtonensis]